jgi:hypothetical protein
MTLATARSAYLRADRRAADARDLARAFPGFGSTADHAARLTIEARAAYAEYRRLLAVTGVAA